MINIDPKTKTERQNYKILIGSVIPRPIAFVTTKGKDEVINGAPFSYFNIVTADPPLLSLSIQRKNGKMKDTAKNIVETEAFVIHTVDEKNVTEINKAAANLKEDESELNLMDVDCIESTEIDVPGIQHANIRFECILEKHLPIQADDGSIATDFIIGRVLQYHVAEHVYMKDDKIDEQMMQSVSRLAGNRYARIGSTFDIERPK